MEISWWEEALEIGEPGTLLYSLAKNKYAKKLGELRYRKRLKDNEQSFVKFWRFMDQLGLYLLKRGSSR